MKFYLLLVIASIAMMHHKAYSQSLTFRSFHHSISYKEQISTAQEIFEEYQYIGSVLHPDLQADLHIFLTILEPSCSCGFAIKRAGQQLHIYIDKLLVSDETDFENILSKARNYILRKNKEQPLTDN